MNAATLKLSIAGLALVLIALGALSGAGVVPNTLVATTATASPTFSLVLNVTASGLVANASMHVTALPQGQMNVSSLSMNWGGTVVVYHPPGVTGHYTVKRSYTFPAAGAYTLTASGVAHDGTAKYTATSNAVAITLPSGNTTKGSAPSVSSAFLASAANLTVTFTDASTVSNGTITSVSWAFGDGQTGTGTPAMHVYAAAGTYAVTETVIATGTGSQTASASSSQNITVTAGVSTACQGTGQCPTSHPFLTLTSGLLIGTGAGLLVAVALWKPEWSAVAFLAFTAAGAVLGELSALGRL